MYSEIKTLSEHIQRVQEFCENVFTEDNSVEDLSFYNDKQYNYNEIIKNNDLPKFIRKNLKYLFKLKIESDIDSLKQKEYYNFEDEDSIELFSSLNTFFLERSFLKSTQLKKIISKIINLHFNFLLRPRFTLLAIFRNEENLVIKVVNNKLANFFEYGELIEGVKLELLNISFDSETISKTQFKNLIKEIDEKLILEMNAKEFLDLVVPIFDLFNIIDENTNENLVPTEALMLFFDDKNLTPIVELLENKYNQEQLIYIDKTTLLSLLIEIIDSISVNNDFSLDDDFSGYEIGETNKIDNMEKESNNKIDIEEISEQDFETEVFELDTDINSKVNVSSDFDAEVDTDFVELDTEINSDINSKVNVSSDFDAEVDTDFVELDTEINSDINSKVNVSSDFNSEVDTDFVELDTEINSDINSKVNVSSDFDAEVDTDFVELDTEINSDINSKVNVSSDFNELDAKENVGISNEDIDLDIEKSEDENINFDNLEDLLNLEHKDYNNIDFSNLGESLLDIESLEKNNSDLEIDGVDSLEDLDKII